MFYFFMSLWVITLLAAIVFLVIRLATKSNKKRNGRIALYSFLVSIVSMIIAIGATPTTGVQPSSVTAAGEAKLDAKQKQQLDFMVFETTMVDHVNNLMINEANFEKFASNIGQYALVDAYDYVKEYKESLDQNYRAMMDVKVPGSLEKEQKDAATKIKSVISSALINNSTALDSFLDYIDSGSVSKLSDFKNTFIFANTYINEEKNDLKTIRQKLGISKPKYEVIFQAKDTHSFYVKSDEISNESIVSVIHDIKTSKDSGMKSLWIYDSKATVKTGERPKDSINPVVEYFADKDKVNYFDGKDSTTLKGLIK